MKKRSTFLLLISTIALNAQVIENPGFEDWETLSNGNEEPVNWSSIQSAEPEAIALFSPQVLLKDDTNPHSGSYCIHLKNVNVPIANIVANGIATNGRVHADFNPDLADVHTQADDDQWYTAFNARPDSIVGYYRYSPEGADITTVQALLHTGTVGALPDAENAGWVGQALFESPNATIAEWTRFSAPFVYFEDFAPEYILFNLSSGNGTNAVEGSQAWYDDFELVYNTVGLDENVANDLLNVYSRDKQIVVDMRKFGAGDNFDLEILSVTGQLLISDQAISGSTKEITIETAGIYICTMRNKDGLTLSKKVVVQ